MPKPSTTPERGRREGVIGVAELTVREYVEAFVETGDDDYEWLRDVVIACFNPPDDDADEPSIMEQAVVRAAEFIESQPCACASSDPNGDNTVPYDDGDQCGRCVALGRYFDEPITR